MGGPDNQEGPASFPRGGAFCAGVCLFYRAFIHTSISPAPRLFHWN